MVSSAGFHLNTKADEALYLQLFNQVVQRVRSGAYPAGYRLPPTRILAKQLGTHRNTIVHAYAELEAAGFVTSSVGRGTFVAQLQQREVHYAQKDQPARMPWASLCNEQVNSETFQRSDRFTAVSSAHGVINLARMQPSKDLIPHELLRRCAEHVFRTSKSRALGYVPAEGLPQLRELIAKHLAFDGVPASADDIVITTGSQQGLDLIARALVRPGDVVLTDASTYPGALKIFALSGARVLAVPADDEGPNMRELARLSQLKAKALYLMPDCNNPTASVVSQRRREELVDWSHDACVPIIEDDYGSDLKLESDEPLAPLRALDGDVLHTGTFSKKLAPGLRIGFLVVPRELRPMLLRVKQAMDLGTSVLLQYVLSEFLDRGYLVPHIRRVVPEYKKRRDALVSGIRSTAPRGIDCSVPRSGVVLWVPLPRAIDPVGVFEAAKGRGVLVSPSVIFGAGGSSNHGIRLTYCAESPERVREGGKRVGAILQSLAKQADKGSTQSEMAMGFI